MVNLIFWGSGGCGISYSLMTVYTAAMGDAWGVTANLPILIGAWMLHCKSLEMMIR